MTRRHVYVVDDTVMQLFAERSKREREDLLKIFKALADDPYQPGEWRQKTRSGRELRSRRETAAMIIPGVQIPHCAPP